MSSPNSSGSNNMNGSEMNMDMFSTSNPMSFQQQIPLIVPPPSSSSSPSPPTTAASTTSSLSPTGGGPTGRTLSTARSSGNGSNNNRNSVNINILPGPAGIPGSSAQLSPASAALSTAAAVAAISSCLSNATIPTTSSTTTVPDTGKGEGIGSSNNSSAIPTSNIRASVGSSKSGTSTSKHDNIDASSIMLSIPIIAPTVSNTTTTVPNQQGFNQHGYGNLSHLQKNQNKKSAGSAPVTAAPAYHQNQNSSISCASRSNNMSNSSSNSPCPTPGPPIPHSNLLQHQQSSSMTMTPCPGPLAPPPSRLLAHPPPLPRPSSAAPGTTTTPSAAAPAVTQSSNCTNTMLPQNQLVYNHIPVSMPISLTAPSPSVAAVPLSSINNSASATSSANSITTGNSSISGRHPGAIISNIVPPPNTSIATPAAAGTSTTLYRRQQPQYHQPTHNQQQRNAVTSSFRPRNVQIATPSIFANMSLRRGKWTSEEERFANALIEEFEKGTILDCENGCTLRAYLSRKLHCAPMRISKKYAGKSIGKHVFLSRMPSIMNSRNGQGGSSGNMRTTQDNLDRIRDLEFHFHMSLLQEGAGCGLGQNIGKGLSSVVGGGRTATAANVMNCVQGRHGQASVLPRSTVGGAPVANGELGANGRNGSFPMIYPSPHSSVPNFCQNGTTTTGANSYLNITSQNVAAAPNASTTFQWFTPGPVNTNAPGPSSSITSAPSVSAPSTTMQMQETLFNAFKEAQNSSAPSATTGVQQSQLHITPSPSTNNATVQGLTGKGQNGKVQSRESNSNGASNGSNISNTFTFGESQHTVSELFPTTKFHDVSTGNNSVIESNMNGVTCETKEEDNDTSISTSQAQQNWLSETMHIIPTLDPSSYMGQFSPTYTSQSFDDLHQFIGKDCPPSTSITNQQTATTGIEGPATDAANKLEQSNSLGCDMSSAAETGKYGNGYVSAADSYALFAQQSAMAVSKHSAYATPLPTLNSIPPIGIHNGGVSIPHGSTNISAANGSKIYPLTSSSEIDPVSSKEQQVVVPLLSSSYQELNPRVKREQIVNIHSSSMKVQHEQIITTSKNPKRVPVKQEEDISAKSAAFSAANLQLHSAAVEEMERSDKKGNTEVSRTDVSENVPNSSSVLRHTNIVSGSDRSGSDNGNDSLSAGGSGSSGSENASDNSDTASDEGQSSSTVGANSRNKPESNSKRRKKIDGDQDAKRQKMCASVRTKTMQ